MPDQQPDQQEEKKRSVNTGTDLRSRMAAMQNTPGSPPSSVSTPVSLPSSPPPRETAPQSKDVKAEKTKRASHFVDERGIAWTRTGLTLPSAYWKGLIAYVNEKKLQWQPGEEKVTQQEIIVQAIGIWLNDQRAKLPASVNAECDEVRRLLR